MGHRINYIEDMFSGVRYNVKSTEDIRSALDSKVTELRDRIKDRRRRLEELRQTYNLTHERLAQLMALYEREGNSNFSNYNNQGQQDGESLVPAGVLANISSEYSMIDSEQEQLQKVELVLRNIQDEVPYLNPKTGEHHIRKSIHKLSDDELMYLNF